MKMFLARWFGEVTAVDGWKQQHTVEGKPQAACACGKCLRAAQG